MKPKKIVFVIFIIGFLMVIVGFLFFNKAHNNNSQLISENNNFFEDGNFYRFSDIKTVDNGKLENEKGIYIDEYRFVELSYHYEKLLAAVKKINQATEDYYQKAITSDTIFTKECSAKIEDKYIYSFGVTSFFYFYEDERYIFVGVQRDLRYICLGEVKSLPAEVVIYDRKKDRILSQKDYWAKIDMNEEKIEKAIQTSLKKKGEDASGKYSKFVLFYDISGNMYVSYYDSTKENYSIISIRK